MRCMIIRQHDTFHARLAVKGPNIYLFPYSPPPAPHCSYSDSFMFLTEVKVNTQKTIIYMRLSWGLRMCLSHKASAERRCANITLNQPTDKQIGSREALKHDSWPSSFSRLCVFLFALFSAFMGKHTTTRGRTKGRRGAERETSWSLKQQHYMRKFFMMSDERTQSSVKAEDDEDDWCCEQVAAFKWIQAVVNTESCLQEATTSITRSWSLRGSRSLSLISLKFLSMPLFYFSSTRETHSGGKSVCTSSTSKVIWWCRYFYNVIQP